LNVALRIQVTGLAASLDDTSDCILQPGGVLWHWAIAFNLVSANTKARVWLGVGALLLALFQCNLLTLGIGTATVKLGNGVAAVCLNGNAANAVLEQRDTWAAIVLIKHPLPVLVALSAFWQFRIAMARNQVVTPAARYRLTCPAGRNEDLVTV
jgi:hypothetical protein